MMESGLYIHVPFCASKCDYCDFYSHSDAALRSDYIDALLLEMQTEAAFLSAGKPMLRTIYFGGGTPSMLSEAEFERIFEGIRCYYDLSLCEEITLEANPDDLTIDAIQALRRLPFNRISIGIQSLNDAELRAIHRRHTAVQALEAVHACAAAGFQNISVDLMYGLPEQTVEQFEESLRQVLNLPIQHISSYALSWEEGSVLYAKRMKGLLKEADDAFLETCYHLLASRLAEKGFERYELSNFAKPGFVSKHNSSYWDGRWYLGLGPSAHSYNGVERRMNVASTKRYIQSLRNGKPDREVEPLDHYTRYNDYIMTRLRTMAGFDVREMEADFGVRLRYYCMQQAKKSLHSGLLLYENFRLRLSDKALFVSDSVLSDLIWA